MYRAGAQNAKADILTCREDDVKIQDKVKIDHRTRAMLVQDQIDPRIWQELQNDLDHPTGEVQDQVIGSITIINEPLALVNWLLKANQETPSLQALRVEVEAGTNEDLTLEDGLLLCNNHLVVPDVDQLRTALIREAHDSVLTAHPGRDKTYKLLKPQYYWKGMLSDIERYIRNCHACRRAHVPRDKTPGLLHPLPITERPYQHITMDWKSFPMDKEGHNNLVVFMDTLSKAAISIPCKKTITAEVLARLYTNHCLRIMGFPDTITSDRDPRLVSDFWTEFYRIVNIQRKVSTAAHAQTNGQTEIINQYIDQRLRPFVNHYQDNWGKLIPLMDYTQLTLPSKAIGMTPWEVLHGSPPTHHFDWETPAPNPPTTATQKLNREKATKVAKCMDEAIAKAKEILKDSQERMETAANRKRRPVDFDINNKVWITTRNWKTDHPSRKLASQQAGPFTILEKKGYLYKLDLPASMKVHPTFSANKLQKVADNPLPGQIVEPPEPIVVTDEPEWEVEEVIASKLDHRTLKYRAKWLGHDEDPEYYPASDFMYAPAKLVEFHLQNPTQPGPPRALLSWKAKYLEGIDDYNDLQDNHPMDAKARAKFFQSK